MLASCLVLQYFVYCNRVVSLLNMSTPRTLLAENYSTPDGLAVDWVADNIYWTDAGRKKLEVARMDGTCQKIIIHSLLQEPRAVAVFPSKG